MQSSDPNVPISVLMTAYNAAQTIAETITSVLNQTFPNFEFIIVNDGSTDNTEEIVAGYKDKRIRLLNNSNNMGIIDSANNGLEHCRGEYICRIDADDICHKDRFLHQYRFMERRPNCIVSGTHYRKIKNNKIAKSSSKHFFHVRDKKLRVEMLRNSPLGNPTVMFRKRLITEFGLQYDPEYLYCEDYAFFCQAMKYGELHIINRPLVYYRQHSEQISTRYADQQCQNANRIRQALIIELVPDISPEELATHLALMTDMNPRSGISDEAVLEWVNKVCKINKEKRLYDVKLFNRLMTRRQKRLF